MGFNVGTSGFSYKEWKGPFYPETLKDSEMLSYYAGRLSCVEINNTFYRMPKREVIRAWADQVPDDFRFVIKASRRITHFKRFKEADEQVGYLFACVAELGDKLGAVLFQLPPNMRVDMARLTAFVELLPHGFPVALEFRHESWFTDEVYACLRAKNIAICHADDDASDLPMVATADWGYLRLRGSNYDTPALKQWIKTAKAAGWRDCHVFFKHEEATGPAIAMQFQTLASAAGSRRTAN